MIKTGILGGTFNPIHLAHLAMAKTAMEQSGLDEIWFMPSKNPPHKSHREIASEIHRSQMIRLAIQSEPSFHLSDYELKREGTTYTAETLQLLQKDYPDKKFYFIMGGDSFFQLESWFLPEVIMKHCEILVVSRNGATAQQMQKHAAHLQRKYQAKLQILQMEDIDISSSQIRYKISRGQEIRNLTPEPVADYIESNHLYR